MTRLLIAFLMLMTPALARAQAMSDVDLARAAYRFAFPVYQMMFQRGLGAARLPPGFNGTNMMFHRGTLADHNAREVSTPNSDVMYSNAWLDLSGPPVLLTIPALPKRYHSVALLNLFTENVIVLGTRANGGQGGRYAIVGPAWQGTPPENATLIRAPTNDIWLAIRMLIDGPEELPTARLLQSGFTVTTLGTAPYRPMAAPASNPTDPAIFLAVVNEALARGPLPPREAKRAAELRSAGIGVPFESLSPDMKAVWRDNARRFYDELKGGLGSIGSMSGGWSYPKSTLGIYGDDDLYRAKAALGAMAALPNEQAIYISTSMDEGGMPLDGFKAYRLHLPAKVPVNAFWSLSLYEVADDGRLFFVDNPIRRYAIGDRTRGLKRNADGSLDVLMSSSPPVDKSNWLPAPQGVFRLTFRGYLPQPSLIAGEFRLPPVTRLIPNERAPLLGEKQRGVNGAVRSSRRGKPSFKNKTPPSPIGS